jgi:hypothetical protein
MTYNIWHGECQTFSDAKSIDADSPGEAMKKCFGKEFKVRSVKNESMDRWIATDDTDDYYFIVKVISN